MHRWTLHYEQIIQGPAYTVEFILLYPHQTGTACLASFGSYYGIKLWSRKLGTITIQADKATTTRADFTHQVCSQTPSNQDSTSSGTSLGE